MFRYPRSVATSMRSSTENKMRLLTQEEKDRFEWYHEDHLAWGSLHIVLEDENLEDDSVQWCIERARERGDEEGEALARILLELTEEQRLNLSREMWKKYHERIWNGAEG